MTTHNLDSEPAPQDSPLRELLDRCEALADSVLEHHGHTRMPSSRWELATALRELVDAVEAFADAEGSAE